MNPTAPRATSVATPDLAADDPRLLISALVDGDTAAVEGACAAWRDDRAARERWHAYHLIGDALRSDELAARPAHDVEFLASLRARLADEPVPPALAPKLPVRARHSWLAPTALAAGFVAVAGMLVLTRLSAPEAPEARETRETREAREATGPVLAVAPAPSTVVGMSGSAIGGTGVTLAAAGSAQQLLVQGGLIRDARLDSYLRAHREALGSTPVALPGGAPRNVEMLLPVASAIARPVSPAAAAIAPAR